MKKMKNIFKILAASAALLATGCERTSLTVDPQDSLVKENYYNSPEAVRANTASLYGSVWFDFTCRFQYMGGDMLSGDLFYTYSDEGQFYLNTVTDNNQYSNSGWQGTLQRGLLRQLGNTRHARGGTRQRRIRKRSSRTHWAKPICSVRWHTTC